jgi:hypothetical protein
MENLTFESRRKYHYWWVQPLILGMIAVGLAGIMFHSHQITAGVGTLIVVGAALWYSVWKTMQVAERVAISDKQFEAWNYGGKHVCLRWDQIDQLRQFNVAEASGPIRVIRVIPMDREEQIVVTDLLNNFTDLVAQIKTKVPHARIEGKPSFWERILGFL